MKKLRQLEDENRWLKQMVAELALDIQALKAISAKTGRAPRRSERRRSRWPIASASATSLSVARIGLEHAAVPQSASGRCGPTDANPTNRRERAALWVPPDLCPVTARRLAREPQEGGTAVLSRRTALSAAAPTEEGRGVATSRLAEGNTTRTRLCDGLCP